MRSGTENVCGIMGLGVAVKKIFDNFDEDNKRMCELRDSLAKGLLESEGTKINGPLSDEKTKAFAAPHIVSVSVKGVRAEVLLHSLEEKGIYISSGSACASNKPAVSATLRAIGVDKDLLDSTVRFSLSVLTAKDEIDYALENFRETIEKLRLYVRR